MLERLAVASGGIYALNSGIVAMTEIAKGGLGAFVNIITNPWDVAAGEVIVKACGGKVTNFENEPIRYASIDPISVIDQVKSITSKARMSCIGKILAKIQNQLIKYPLSIPSYGI